MRPGQKGRDREIVDLNIGEADAAPGLDIRVRVQHMVQDCFGTR